MDSAKFSFVDVLRSDLIISSAESSVSLLSWAGGRAAASRATPNTIGWYIRIAFSTLCLDAMSTFSTCSSDL